MAVEVVAQAGTGCSPAHRDPTDQLYRMVRGQLDLALDKVGLDWRSRLSLQEGMMDCIGSEQLLFRALGCSVCLREHRERDCETHFRE